MKKLLVLILLTLIQVPSYADFLAAGTYGSGCYGSAQTLAVSDFELDNSQFLSRANALITDIKFGNVDFTIAGWVNMESKAVSSSANIIMGVNNPTGNQRSYTVQYNNAAPAGADRFAFSISSDGTGAASTVVNDAVLGSPSIGVWYFIVAYHDAANDLIGIQINNGTATTAAHSTGAFASTTADFRFGSNGNGALFFDGKLSQWTIWNRVLNTTERSQLYNNGLGASYGTYVGSKSGLLHWWPLNDMSEVTAQNYVLTNNNTVTQATGFIYGCS